MQYKVRPEIDTVNFVSRVTVPTLMLNGRYDIVFPYESNVLPAYNLLGTPKENKKLVMYHSDHSIPRNELMKETLEWLDRYLGPVN